MKLKITKIVLSKTDDLTVCCYDLQCKDCKSEAQYLAGVPVIGNELIRHTCPTWNNEEGHRIVILLKDMLKEYNLKIDLYVE